MKQTIALTIFVLLCCSCSPPKVETKANAIQEYISDLKVGTISYFKYNGISSETDGIFNHEYNDEPMWTLVYKDIEDWEKIIEMAIRDKKTSKGHPDIEPGLVEVSLSDADVSLLQKLIGTKSYYREYNVGTNKAYNKIMEVTFYDSDHKDYAKKVRQVFCDMDNKVILIRQE